jgi:putative heme iron utilization protein
MNWKNMKTLQAPIIIYLMEAPRNMFSIYVGRDFCELVADQTNIHAE